MELRQGGSRWLQNQCANERCSSKPFICPSLRHHRRPLPLMALPHCRYYPTLTTGGTSNYSGQPASSSELSSCDDAILTALAQAGVFQTGTDRSLISLFDADYQYIVAEATPSSRLLPSVRSGDCRQPLWLCGTSIHRSHGVCEISLLSENTI
jgi:hypothetical protein